MMRKSDAAARIKKKKNPEKADSLLLVTFGTLNKSGARCRGHRPHSTQINIDDTSLRLVWI